MKNLFLAFSLALLTIVSGCASSTAPQPTEQVTTGDIAVAVQTISENVVYFDYNMYNISENYSTLLQTQAEYLRQFPSIRIRIEGNCDARGTQEYNLALGERRARAVYEYLVRLGVNPDQLEVISYGKERPVAFGDTEDAYAKNRRDAFTVIAQ